MLHTEIASNDARLSRQPDAGEAVIIDRYLAEPPYELTASEVAIRAQALDEQPEDTDFDFAGLADALGA